MKKKSRTRKSKAPAKRRAKVKQAFTLADVHRHCGADLIEPLEETRQIILETVPNVQERIYSEGRGIGYHVPGIGVRFGIFFTRTSVALVFPYGELLPDPGRLIDGHAKKSSWVNIRPGKAVPHEALSRLLLAALME